MSDFEAVMQGMHPLVVTARALVRLVRPLLCFRRLRLFDSRVRSANAQSHLVFLSLIVPPKASDA